MVEGKIGTNLPSTEAPVGTQSLNGNVASSSNMIWPVQKTSKLQHKYCLSDQQRRINLLVC